MWSGTGDHVNVGQAPSRRVAADTPSPWLWVVAALALLLGSFLVLSVLNGPERLGMAAASSDDYAYLIVALLVFGDGVCAVFPGETTLNTASALAAQGQLSLSGVMIAGAVGAIAGDSALYWIARLSGHRFHDKLDKATRNARVSMAMDLIGTRASVMLCLGRYVPGLRFVVNATCGLSELPYRRFLLWSAVGGTLWSVVTCTIAYLVSTVFSGYTLASVVISGAIGTIAVAVLILVVRSQRSRAQPAS